MERIICSAIHFDDGVEHVNQPKNIATGYVICGRRHHNCFATAAIFDKERNYLKHEKEQGFLTSEDRFLTREEAHQLFVANGGTPEYNDRLFSEDLY